MAERNTKETGMELGNLLFGNSRGEYEVDRYLEEQFVRWMEKLGFDSYGNKRDWAWSFYENDVFRMQTYYWGDCTCGYDKKEWQWCEDHKHSETCYQFEYRKIGDTHKFFSKEGKALIEELCGKHGLSYPSGCAVHCTCDYQNDWVAWRSENEHAETCALIQPNFLFKPTGFTLDWYKYPLRNSYSSEPLTEELIDEMFAECERSMREG
jgi:hypothetical protein